MTAQSSEKHVSEETKSVKQLLDRRPGKEKSQSSGHNGGPTSVKGRERLKRKYTSEIILAPEVENSRAPAGP